MDVISRRIREINNRLAKLETRKNKPLQISKLESEKAELMGKIYADGCPVNRVCLCAGDCKLMSAAVEGTLHLQHG